MSELKPTIKYFSKSNLSIAELRKARKDAGIRQGLVSVGKTQFVTHWSAAVALETNLPLMKNLISDGIAKPKVCVPVLGLDQACSLGLTRAK
jgi:hypothetical protein